MLRCSPVYTDTSAQFQQESCHPQPSLTQRTGSAGQDRSWLTLGDKSRVSYGRGPKGSAITRANRMLWATQRFNLSECQCLGSSLHPPHLANRSMYHGLLNRRRDGGWVPPLPRRCSITGHQPNLQGPDSAQLRSQTSPTGLEAGEANPSGVGEGSFVSPFSALLDCSQINSFSCTYLAVLRCHAEDPSQHALQRHGYQCTSFGC